MQNNDFELATAVNFIQYESTNKIITIIGEYHNYNFTCKNNNKDISQYCFERIKDNKNCKILLEYSKYDNPKTIGSKIINNTYNKFLKNKKKSHIIPIDFRTLFLKFRGQSDLYDIVWEKNNYSKTKIKNKIIEPFYKLATKILIIDNKDYDSNIYYNISNYIINDIVVSFNYILKNIDNFNISKLQQYLKKAWNKVMDVGILLTVLKNNKITEYILIAGNAHCENLYNIINKYFTKELKLVNKQSGDKGNCVQLKDTVTI